MTQTQTNSSMDDHVMTLLEKLHTVHPQRSYAVVMIGARPCVVIRSANAIDADRLVSGLPTKLRNMVMLSVADVLEADLHAVITAEELNNKYTAAYHAQADALEDYKARMRSVREVLAALCEADYEAPHSVKDHELTWFTDDGPPITLYVDLGAVQGVTTERDVIVCTHENVADVADELGVPKKPTLRDPKDPKAIA